jgi:hypothetical protein
MTTAADDSAVEDAFEALLVGRPAPEGAAGLAAFTMAVRASADRPGRPNAALAELLATGLLTDQSSPSVRTARSAGSAPERRPSRVRIRRRTTMILPVLIAKFLSAGALAQAATGATVAVVAFTGVGAVGALPDPVQDTFATVVAEVTPFGPATPEESTGAGVPEKTEDEVVEVVEPTDAATGTADETTHDAAAVEAEIQAWALEGPAEGESFGAWVAEGSKDHVKHWLRNRGMSFGNVVSAWANGKGLSEEQLVALGAHLGRPTDVPVGTVPEEESPVVTEREDVAPRTATATTGNHRNGEPGAGSYGNRNGQGNGNGNGNGQGNGYGDGRNGEPGAGSYGNANGHGSAKDDGRN